MNRYAGPPDHMTRRSPHVPWRLVMVPVLLGLAACTRADIESHLPGGPLTMKLLLGTDGALMFPPREPSPDAPPPD